MMRSAGLLEKRLQGPQSFICWRCLQKRSVSTSFLNKKREAKEQWNAWATEIRAGKRKSMLEVLEERGFVHAIVGDRHALSQLMINKRLGAYVGVDPTASSMHVGHMLPMMALAWMYLYGFHAVSLIGGATSKIGDPTGRTTARVGMTSTERKANIVSMHYQIKRLWGNVEHMGRKHGYKREVYWHRELANNAIWWNNITFVDILKLLGPGLRLGTMLSRDTVKTKMDSKDGMSFAEFCYPILQAWDWWYMYSTKNIQMQIGGADQYGNIVAGVDAVKYIAKTHPDPDVRQEGGVHELNTPFGFTVPLLTTAAGEKFGKSAGNAIWLDKDMTSLFDLYGFFVRTADADVERYLKLFTFLTMKQITDLCDRHRADPSKRIAQHALAFEFVELVHGPDAAKDAETQHRTLFHKQPSLANLRTSSAPSTSLPNNPNTFNQNADKREESTFASRQLNKYAPAIDSNTAPSAHVVLPRSLVHMQSIAKVLFSAGLVTSRSEGHRLAQNQGAYIGRRASGKEAMSDDISWVPAKLMDPMQTWQNLIFDNQKAETMEGEGEEGLLVLRSGKWNIRVCRIVSDEKFERDKFAEPPGWSEWKATVAGEKAMGRVPKQEEAPFMLSDEVELKGRGMKKARETEREKSREKGRQYFYEAKSQ